MSTGCISGVPCTTPDQDSSLLRLRKTLVDLVRFLRAFTICYDRDGVVHYLIGVNFPFHQKALQIPLFKSASGHLVIHLRYVSAIIRHHLPATSLTSAQSSILAAAVPCPISIQPFLSPWKLSPRALLFLVIRKWTLRGQEDSPA